ncbi:hypothetical protein BV22DRAFT_1130895 [Leucogyrophana mollusca]|uniref:Uncharacterized protein n=1 Tax=Leucogyrophana mollusca TaxID=85980 RepID=A0ACB8BC96_9AGAM|nr:hypothetical protein BV22DRAFT_1130895 [Leucogyrophana mollusca]
MSSEGHYELWKEGIHHHDISESNLMYYRNAEGVAVGVLNDFDISSTRDSDVLRYNERTGTIQFMAMELLRQPTLDGHKTHEYYHDAESFIWVLAWVTLHHEHGTRLPRKDRALESLLSLQPDECSDKKAAFLMTERNVVQPPPSQQKNWEVAVICLKMLGLRYAERGGKPIDVVMEEAYKKWLHDVVKDFLD